MCNIAGYAGTRPAAPILLEMLRRQEGFAGGYYSGIATVDHGKIHYAKLTGDVRRLIENTGAASFPGTVGIIHSRSKSGGGDAWAHPFVGPGAGDPRIALVVNGTLGVCTPRKEEYTALAQSLIDGGYPMSSRVPEANEKYFTLPDRSSVHISDVMCQLILRNTDRGADPVSAMTGAFCEMPLEIVGLLLSLSDPDAIFWSRFNYPMFAAFAADGGYLASTPTAFPESVGEPMLLPACASGRLDRGGVSVRPYPQSPLSVAPTDARLRAAVYETVLARLTDGECSYSELNKEIKPLFAPADCVPSGAAVNEALYSLQKQGKLRIGIRSVPGARDGLTAPKCFFSLENAESGVCE